MITNKLPSSPNPYPTTKHLHNHQLPLSTGGGKKNKKKKNMKNLNKQKQGFVGSMPLLLHTMNTMAGKKKQKQKTKG